MGSEERLAWLQVVLTPPVLICYALAVVTSAGGGPIAGVDWFPIMAIAIGAGIVASIVAGIGWGMVAGMADEGAHAAADVRDRDIAKMAGRVDHALLIIAGIGVIALAAFASAPFWIATTMFAGFGLANIAGGIARIIAYRSGI